ncbi:DUF1365 domain-containing protein [Chitinimonas sp.]|uniref:DUF1365 domain-containing protein n=1 Tax=Chitinimonas sp. TaxID=1934313 RepID=UPI002F91D94D
MDCAHFFVGQVMHERLRPIRHRFVYPVFFLRCDVDRLSSLKRWWFGVDRPHLLSLRSRDYGEGQPGPWMRGILAEAGLPCDGEIWLQTFPRVLGYVFNPVSFWYCHDKQGRLIALLADVRNTFGERHRYLLTGEGNGAIEAGQRLRCRKVFHVSPFCEVEGHYEFRLRDTDATAFVGIDYHDRDGLLLRTAVGGRCQPFDFRHVWWAVLRQPLLTFGIVARIHLQAFHLWRRKVAFFRKPSPPAHTLSHSRTQGSQP